MQVGGEPGAQDQMADAAESFGQRDHQRGSDAKQRARECKATGRHEPAFRAEGAAGIIRVPPVFMSRNVRSPSFPRRRESSERHSAYGLRQRPWHRFLDFRLRGNDGPVRHFHNL